MTEFPGFHVAVDEGDAYDFLTTLSIVKASGAATNHALAVVEQRMPAGFVNGIEFPPPPAHTS